MKKVLLYLLAFTMVFSSMSLLSFTDDVISAGEFLEYYGFVTGDDNGDLLEDRLISRQEMAILLARINGKEKDAERINLKTVILFEDDDDIAPWAKQYVYYAQKQGWITGDENKFNPISTISGEQLAIMLLRMLGYAEASWNSNRRVLSSLTGIQLPESILKRGEVFEALWPAVSEPLMSDGRILGVAAKTIPESDIELLRKEEYAAHESQDKQQWSNAQTTTAYHRTTTTTYTTSSDSTTAIQTTRASNSYSSLSYQSSGSFYPGEYATVSIHGKPHTEYSITVRLSSGPSRAAGLYNKMSDADGYVSWTWKIGTKTKSGTYSVHISGGGESITRSITVE